MAKNSHFWAILGPQRPKTPGGDLAPRKSGIFEVFYHFYNIVGPSGFIWEIFDAYNFYRNDKTPKKPIFGHFSFWETPQNRVFWPFLASLRLL